jgi:cyclohexyl-isocyanide hydratase
MSLQIGLLLFPQVTLLDLVGPHEVFAGISGAQVHLVSETMDPVVSGSKVTLMPTTTFADCPNLDVICVPGGGGVNALLKHAPTLEFVRRQAQTARFVTSVCTGALVLGAAGLLSGKEVTTHWASLDLLKAFGAKPIRARVVRDGNLLSGGGVTAGIDFALTLAAELIGREDAQAIQLNLEYAPQPPFESGTPETAPAEVLAKVRTRGALMRAEREALVAEITR